MADIYYTQASPDWEIESADVAANVHNIHDRNFGTIYTITGAGTPAEKDFWIDRGAEPISGSRATVDAIGIVMTSGSYVNIVGPRWKCWQNIQAADSGKVGYMIGSLDWPQLFNPSTGIFVMDLPTDYNMRYINIATHNMNADPQVVQVMLLKKHTTPRNHSIKKSTKFPRRFTNVQQLDGPNIMTHSNFSTYVWAYRNHYPLYGPTEYLQGIEIFNDMGGRLEPFLYVDGLDNSAHPKKVLCQGTKDEPRMNPREHDHDEITYEFQEIYKIVPGYTT